jgi:hypothetical protein
MGKQQNKQGGGQQQQQQGQKRKAEAPAAPQQKKPQPQAPAAQQQKQAPKPQQPQQAKKPQQAAQPQKKAAKKPEPEPEPESEEDEDEAGGEVDEEALAAIDVAQPAMDKLSDELAAFDDQMNAEIYAVQKKFLLKKRPVMQKRDKLLSGVKGLWAKLFAEHLVFASQLEAVDHEILKNLTTIEEEQVYSAAGSDKQQITGITVIFTFSAGSKLVKAGRFKKEFKFDEEKETLLCVPSPDKPFVSGTFAKDNSDSFFNTWFTSEGSDDGVLAAHDALSSELYVDPLQLYRHLAEGNPMPSMDGSDSEGDDDDDAMMSFESDEDDDEEAPELV